MAEKQIAIRPFNPSQAKRHILKDRGVPAHGKRALERRVLRKKGWKKV
jgi:hypothetical protein